MEQLYAVGFLVGALSVLFSVSYEAALPSLVGRAHLLAANGRLEASRSLARVAGPGLAGLLAQAISAPVVLLFLVEQLGLQPATVGGLRSLGCAWWLPGALLAGRTARRLGQGPTVVLGATLIVVVGLALVAAGVFPAHAVPILLAGGVATGLANPLYNITDGSLKQAVTPDRLLLIPAPRPTVSSPRGGRCRGWRMDDRGLVPQALRLRQRRSGTQAMVVQAEPPGHRTVKGAKWLRCCCSTTCTG